MRQRCLMAPQWRLRCEQSSAQPYRATELDRSCRVTTCATRSSDTCRLGGRKRIVWNVVFCLPSEFPFGLESPRDGEKPTFGHRSVALYRWCCRSPDSGFSHLTERDASLPVSIRFRKYGRGIGRQNQRSQASHTTRFLSRPRDSHAAAN